MFMYEDGYLDHTHDCCMQLRAGDVQIVHRKRSGVGRCKREGAAARRRRGKGEGSKCHNRYVSPTAGPVLDTADTIGRCLRPLPIGAALAAHTVVKTEVKVLLNAQLI